MENSVGLHTFFTIPQLLLSKFFPGTPAHAFLHCSPSLDFLKLDRLEGLKMFELKSHKF